MGKGKKGKEKKTEEEKGGAVAIHTDWGYS